MADKIFGIDPYQTPLTHFMLLSLPYKHNLISTTEDINTNTNDQLYKFYFQRHWDEYSLVL